MLELVYYPDPILKKRAQPVPRVNEGIRSRAREMFQVMYREKGVGLAAPQVGWSARIFVANPGGDEDLSGERVYVNPEITVAEGEVVDEEGCLSIPGVRGDVARYQRIVVRALNAEGVPFEEDIQDLHARVVQHELDHLDGILFITRLSVSDRMLAAKVLKKLEKEYKSGVQPGR